MSSVIDQVEKQGKEKYVHEVFDSIAPYYDLMNVIMTGGMVKLWHRAFLRQTNLKPGDHCLDVACGTGDLAILTAVQVGPAGRVTGVDFSEEMLSFGRKKVQERGLSDRIELVWGNAMSLQYPEDTFDCATIGFALRNVPDIKQVVSEMQRVVRPGARVVSLEVSKPRNPLLRWPAFLYFYNVVPLIDRVIGRAVRSAGQIRPYTWLPHSLTSFPTQDGLADIFREVGLVDVYYKGMSGGMVSLHVGTKPDK